MVKNQQRLPREGGRWPIPRNIQVQVRWGFEWPGVVEDVPLSAPDFLKHWFNQWAKTANCSLSFTAGSLLPRLCSISPALLYIAGFNFSFLLKTFSFPLHFSVHLLQTCFNQLNIENQPWFFSKLSLLKWQQQHELSGCTTLYKGRIRGYFSL